MEAAIKAAILATADRAWKIAADGCCADAVCLAIEALSDDPTIEAAIVAEVVAKVSGA
jgi:N-acetyl-gamma-glutamylphosphate reductase